MKKKLLSLAALALITLAIRAANLTLVWDPSPDDAGTNYVRYAVYQATGTNAFTNVVNVGTNRTYTFTNITPGLYRFYVTAQDIWTNESGPSNTLLIPGPIIPRPPQQPILYVLIGSKTNIISLGQ
jgi:hypothetical protein